MTTTTARGVQTDAVPDGIIGINGRPFRVYVLPVLPNSARAGVKHEFALVGPREAHYLVVDYGPGFRLNSIACGGGDSRGAPAPRPLRGLTREHLAAFGVDV